MLKKRKKVAKVVLFLFLTAQLAGISLLFPTGLEAGELTTVSDTLSNNRLSFRGELEGAVAAGSGVITLDTTPENSNNTSTGSASLMQNENVRVGSGSTADILAVKTIDTATRITLAAPGLTTAASDGDPVIATVSAIHTVSFTPASTITNGAFRVLIPGSDTQSTTGDGLPDLDGFDLISDSLPTVSCSGGGAGFTFKTGTATASATQVGGSGAWYHSFECRYYGDSAPSSAVTMTIGTAAGNKVLNPSPSGYSATHFPGQMDTYTFRTRHTYGTAQSYSVADETLGTIGVVEAVRVTATVAPTLTFHLSAVNSSTTFCGGTEGSEVTTTVNTVPFDTISTSAFTNAAHQLVISTNADEGYAVTASESGALSIGGLGTTTIADTSCDGTPTACTVTAAQEWSTEANKGFGYALQDLAGDCVTNTLEYNNGGATFKARPFGITAQQIMLSTEPVADDSAYVCYRVIVSGTQTAGDYSNYVIYIATATF